MDQHTPPPPIAATTPLVATLTADEWNMVQQALQVLMQPMRSVSEKLARQLFAQAREMPRPPAIAPEDYGPIEEQQP